MKLFSEKDILINGPLLSCYIYIEILGLKWNKSQLLLNFDNCVPLQIYTLNKTHNISYWVGKYINLKLLDQPEPIVYSILYETLSAIKQNKAIGHWLSIFDYDLFIGENVIHVSYLSAKDHLHYYFWSLPVINFLHIFFHSSNYFVPCMDV